MKLRKDIIIILIILIDLIVGLNINYILKSSFNASQKQDWIIEGPQTSDIAGTDLYAENIDVVLAGNTSLIKQSMFSNDTSIFPRFDTRDPAFYKCNILISVSNGILPKAFPKILAGDSANNHYEMSFNSFAGFLYYDNDLDAKSVEFRANRALEIIKRKFEIDLILINVSDIHFIPFIGYYPNWELFLREVTGNLPMDGYWKALDLQRLSSSNYFNTNHLSSTFFIINDLNILNDDFLESIDQVNFNLESLDLSFLESIDIETIFEQFSTILVDYSSLFGNFTDFININETVSQENIESLSEIFNTFELSNESHYVSLMIQYEGLSEGITSISDNQYKFDLWKSLNYLGEPLRPSEKVFIALSGAFMSNINIKIYSTEIIDVTPTNFDFYDFLLEQIGLILFYADIDFDIETLKAFSFNLIWEDEGGFKRSYVIPVNLEESTNFINFLHLLGLQGFPGIPTGLFNPIGDLIINYKISNSEPNIVIKKELINPNSSYGIYKDFSFNITAKNMGNETAWGIPTSIPITLDDAFTFIVGPIGSLLGYDDDLKEAIWQVVNGEYPNQYDNLEDFFNFDENPRIFYFDTTGAGLIDTYYPNMLNFTNLLPYNSNMGDIIDIINAPPPTGNTQLIASLIAIGIYPDDLINTFTNPYSIWNEDNWKLEPNKTISYTLSNFSISYLDSFTSFYSYNFTIRNNFPQLPSLISGFSINDTNPYMALELDKESWQITSEQKYVNQHELEIQFLFKNESYIDFWNNSLDRVSVVINLNDPESLMDIEIFNFSTEEFQDISDFLVSAINDTQTFSFVKNEGTLDWLFDPSSRNNHTIIIRLIGVNLNQFNISINDFNVEFSYRDVNEYKIQRSRVIYSSFSGLVEYIRFSNDISLSTYEMASIVSYSHVLNFNSKIGESNEYSLILTNIGTKPAFDVNITIPLPGIIYDTQNFTLEDNKLKYRIPILNPSEEILIKFSFYTPNSIKISETNVTYHNQDYIKNLNSSFLVNKPNEVYITAPIDYRSRFPYIKIIDIHYNSSLSDPRIGDIFNITIGIKNRSPAGLGINNLSITMNNYYGDLKRIDYKSLTIENLEQDELETMNISILKENWKGYYYPSINFIDNYESNVIQIGHSGILVLGFINLSILKTINKNQVEIGDTIEVKLTVINTGTICIGEVDLSDIFSFTQLEFNLISGSLINRLDCLKPSENKSFIYEIEALNQKNIQLKPASIEYYYLQKNLALSNQVIVKVMLPEHIKNLFILIPGLISIIILFSFIWQTYKYNSKKYETQKYDSILLKSSKFDSILRIEQTLKEKIKELGQNEIGKSHLELEELKHDKVVNQQREGKDK
ncbi:MAG: hypothetical protein EAX89_03615 [Candidatus Lokiarchaeota archaeon]|nr:hypothetical protein [Candidatus Lokiarchaeota archaeon]